MAVLDTTQFNQLVQQVREALLAGSQGVGEIEVVTTLAGLVSLPALRMVGATETVVEAPLELLAAPAVEAAANAIEATDRAIVAAVNAEAAADLADAESRDLVELKEQTISSGTQASDKGDKALAGAMGAEEATVQAMFIVSLMQEKLEQAQVIILDGTKNQDLLRELSLQVAGSITICAETREDANEAILALRELQTKVAVAIREAYESLDIMQLAAEDAKIATALASLAAERIAKLEELAQTTIDQSKTQTTDAGAVIRRVEELEQEVFQTKVATDLAGCHAEEQAKAAGAAALMTEKITQDAVQFIAQVKEVGDKAEKASADAIGSAAGADAAAENANSAKEDALKVNQDVSAAEKLRVTTETSRATEEGKRVVAEQGRVNVEKVRVTTETSRAAEEGKRVTAEQGRVNVEKVRVTTETSRAAEEGKRVVAEQGRVLAEQSRVTETAQVINKTNTAKDNAQSAANRAKTLSDNPQKIVDGVWHTYDEATKKYVTTGLQAKGDTGSSFRVIGTHPTREALKAAIPDGAEVDGVYGVGAEPPYSYYAWTFVAGVWDWRNQGKLQGQKGESAYEAAVRMQGYDGTEKEYATNPIINAELARLAAVKAGEDVSGFIKTAETTIGKLVADTKKEVGDFVEATGETVTAAVDRSNTLSDNPQKVVDGVWHKYDEETKKYVTTGVRAIPIDWLVRDLDHVPTETDLTYHDEVTGLDVQYPIGAEVRVFDIEYEEYDFYKLYAVTDGVAVWDSSGSASLKQNIYLTGANYASSKAIKQGYL